MILSNLCALTLCTAAVITPTSIFAQQPASTDNGAAHSSKSSSDKMFLHKASMGGYAEIQLGQLAAQKGNSDEVKQFGQKMVDDHTALNEQLKPFADAQGVPAPTKLDKKNQAEYDKLNRLSGDAFDKEYLSFMVKDHHEDTREFRKEQSTAADPALKDAVTKGAGVIQEHTQMVDKLAKDKGISVASHDSGSAPATN